MDTDVFIIGGGPAGLAAAIASRREGLSVVVADGAQPPIDKACGEGLMPDGRAALERLGVSIPAEDGHPFRGIRFVSGDVEVEANFPAGDGIGMRRTVLHGAMIDAAKSAGATLLWRTPVTGLHPEGVMLGEDRVRARWVVGADGGRSLVQRWAGLDRYSRDRARFAFRRHYGIAPWTDCMELHWAQGCQIYVTPVAADEICVALISRDPHLRLENALASFPRLAAQLAQAQPTSPERGAISATRRLLNVYSGRVVLIGDASGGVDAITGEGLCLSFRQAEVLAQCFTTGNLERYQRIHGKLARRPAVMARAMLALDCATPLRQRIMRAFRADPKIFARMLAMHVGALSPWDFAVDGLTLGLRALRA
jgi:flavin-dependent dehydrogenase